MKREESKKMSLGNSYRESKRVTRGIVTFFLVVIIFSAGLFVTLSPLSPISKTKTAQAIAPVVPTGDFLNQIAITTTAANTTAETQKEFTLDYVVNMAAKLMLRSVTNSVVTWINSGFQGSPAFVTDPAGLLTDVADQIAGDFISGTELGFMCEPFSLDIRIALNMGYSADFVEQNYCRLSEVVSNTENFAKFTSGDFTQGGWDSWFEITQNPSNNPLGGFLEAKQELALRTAAGKELKLLDLDWGSGFLSYRECMAENQDGECVEYGPVETPGSVIEEQLNSTLGSGQRQLEVADEINEIVSALVGQLVQTAFTAGLSSFGPGGSNSGSLQTALTVTCSPNVATTEVGQNVQWAANVYGGNSGPITYSWSGEEGLSGTTANINKIYTTQGTKTGRVTVTKGGETVTQACASQVSIPTGPTAAPLDVLCSADRSTANVGEAVTWSSTVVDPSGNSGPVAYNWTGSDPINGATTATIATTYLDPGLKTATVQITKNGQTVSRVCNSTVEIEDPPITVSCRPDRTSVNVGDSVRWTATVNGAGPGQIQPIFTWSGDAPVEQATTQVAEVVYTTPGTKRAEVRVRRYAQDVSRQCSPNVRVVR